MANPILQKGHPNYNTSKDPLKNGGYFGRHDGTYLDEELQALGEGLVEWIQQPKNIFCKGFFAPKGILWQTVHKLAARSPMFKEYLDTAKEIQEMKLVSEPYDKDNNKDANHARFILARHHKGEWEEKNIVVADDAQKAKLETTLDMVDYLQSKKESE